MESQFVLNVRRSAEDSFASGLYCAESVVIAIVDELGVESELLPKAATAFCSGMGRMCGTCGALTGAIMGVGLGRSEASESVQPSYAATQRLIREFEKELNRRLQGHYQYYGVRGNSESLYRFYRWAKACAFKWLQPARRQEE